MPPLLQAAINLEYIYFLLINQPNMHLFGLLKETKLNKMCGVSNLRILKCIIS